VLYLGFFQDGKGGKKTFVYFAIWLNSSNSLRF